MGLIKNYPPLIVNKQKGATSVEFAIVAVLFITVLFAIVEFGFLMFNKQIINNAAREGARLGIVSRPEDSRIPVSDILNRVQSYSASYVVSFGSSLPPNATVSNDPKGAGTSCTGEGVEFISVDVSYNYNFLFIPLATLELTSSARMRCE